MTDGPANKGIDVHDCFRLRDPLATRPLRLTDEGYDEWPTTEQVFALAHGQLKLDCPLGLGSYMGRHATDFLWSGLPPLICVSARLVELLTVNQVTGCSTYPVEVHEREGSLLPGYAGLAVTGGQCERDTSRSVMVDKPPPTPAGTGYQVYRGLYFHKAQWDGSDLFWIRNCGLVVTRRVYELFKRHKVSNVRLTPLTQAERDVKLDDYD
jgi:hypothetical protein